MSKKEICVPTGLKKFKDLLSDYNVSSGDLEVTIKQWLNKGNEWTKDTDDDLKSFLDNHYKVISSNFFNSKSLFNKAHSLWEEIDNNFVTKSKLKAKKVYNTYVESFGEDNVILHETQNGEYAVKVAEPIYKKSTTSNKNVNTLVSKIISGGQTGVDTIGLQVARELGIETGGTAPKGFLREKGIDKEDISSYNLVEITDEEQADYTKRKGKTDPFTGRTELNVRNSDGTVYFYTSDDKAGMLATKRSADDWNKPFITNPTAEQLKQWIIDNDIKTLNVAGNRGSKLAKDNNVAEVLKEALLNSEVKSEEYKWSRTAKDSYEVSSQGDKRFSALNAKFKKGTIIDGVDVSGKTIEDVYQSVVKKSGKGKAPAKSSRLSLTNTDNFSTTFRNFPEGVTNVFYNADDKVPRVIFTAPNGEVGQITYDNKWRISRKQKNSKGEEVFYNEMMSPEDVDKVVSRFIPSKFREYVESGQINKDNSKDFQDNKGRVQNFFRENYNIHLINEYFFEKGKHETFEDFSYYEGYLPLWQEWAKQNPELIEELREKSKGKTLTDKFASTRVSQARALADILNSKPSSISSISNINSNKEITLSTSGYKKGDPQKNTTTDFVFTENAEAYIVSKYTASKGTDTVLPSLMVKALSEFPYHGKAKLNVSDVNGTNQAGIRTDSKGNISPNAYGIVVKKYQQDANGKFVAKEGQFQDTDEDFNLFVELNEDMFKRLSESKNTKVVFPTQMGLGKAALPKKFVKWLQNQLSERFGISSTIEKNQRSDYDGYGLKLNSTSSNNVTIDSEYFNVSNLENSKRQSYAEPITNSWGPIIDVRPFTNKDFEQNSMLGLPYDMVVTFKNGEKIFISPKSGMADTNNVIKLRNDNGLKDFRTFIGFNYLLEQYFKDNIESLSKLNWTSKMSEMNKDVREGDYDSSKDAFAGTPFKSIPNSTSSRQEEVIEETDLLQESEELLNKIIKDSETNIKKHENFDKEGIEGSHTYLIKRGKDWVPVDTSVTQLVHGKVDMGAWGLPSSALGNTVDRFTREYFEGKDVLKSDIPNLNKKDKRSLKGDLDKLSQYFDEKFGKGNYKVVTKEFPIAGKYTVINKNDEAEVKTIAGTMDMIIYDNEGNFYILDMKTSRSSFDDNKINNYSKQLEIYKAILEANYPELKGKIKDLMLIRFDVGYPTPLGERDKYGEGEAVYESADLAEGEDKDTLWIEDEDGNLLAIEDSEYYIAPRLHISPEDALYKTNKVDMKHEFEALTAEEKELIKEEFSFNESGEQLKEDDVETGEEVDNIQTTSLYNNPMLSASERMFLSNNVMNLTSYIITHLQTNIDANNYYFGDRYSRENFTLMSRQDIINTIGIGRIFDYIRETYYNPENRNDIDDFDVLDKLQIAYDNWGALTKSAYAKLITLEGVTVIDTRPEDITRDDLDDNTLNDMESASMEEKEIEYWQLGQRQISAKSSLSGDIRRVFEKLQVTDSEGNPVLDKYGYGFPTFVDSGEAVNKILDWVREATTMEEMESILSDMQESYTWVKAILEKIQEEPFRSQFFQNFRKDFTQYSIITVENGEDGSKKYVNHIINTKGASKVVLEGVINAYKSGLLTDIIIPIKGDIEGRGKVNVRKVTELKKINNSLLDKLHEAHEDKRLKTALSKAYPQIVTLLKSLGIDTNTQILKDAFSSDYSRKQEDSTNYFKVLSSIDYILDGVLSQKDNTEYSPIKKGEDGNVYGDYKKIVRTLSKYIQDSIESSTYENGKMHYSFTTPSYMGKLVTNLKDAAMNPEKFESFMEEEYGSYKWFKNGKTWNNEWLRLLNTGKEYKEGLEHKVQLSFDGTPYTELSELGYTLSLLHEYFYDNKGAKRWAWYRIPILANKPSSEFLRFKRYSGKKYKREITNGLMKVFNQEVMRMRTVLERAVNPDVQKIGVKEKITFDIKDSKLKIKNKKGKEVLNTKLIKKLNAIKNGEKGTLTLEDLVKDGKLVFEGSGAEFKFLSALNNNIINKDALGQLIVDKLNGVEVDEDTLEKELREAIESYMDVQVQSEIKNWERIGLFDTVKSSKKDAKPKFKYADFMGSTREEIEASLEEYVWNDMFATINIIELTATDLAYYRNIEDFQKRYSQVHAPSMRLNVSARDANGNLYSSDGKERTMYLRDNVAVSEIIPIVSNIFDNKIKNLKGEEQKNMKIMKALILKSFEEVNVADAQGYSSPTSYRKKMGMMGKWTSDMETAYNRIKSGDFNVNDLGVVWQPLKPFVYSQIRKSSGASTMSELKVPVQNKNSEYLLVLADAIIRGGNKVSKLTAIFDFMEDSAYDGRVSKDGKVIKEGIYNGRGIDTIQFESAVNSGSLGAVDLNSASSYDEVKSILEKAAYYNADKSESADNDMDIYNDQFVHTISFEDYGIQQEVPAHLVDHSQLMGSQVRILSISDITEGTKFDVRGKELTDTQLKEEYQNLIAENIRDSFNQLVEDFNLKGTKKEKNIAISKLLKEAIQKDQRYGADLLRACSLNSKGEFTIPLSDPIQSIRIQQLINSIIKSRINKQKVKGGPVVQASVFGLSDDLSIKFKDNNGNFIETLSEFAEKRGLDKNDKETHEKYSNFVKEMNGSLAYFECYMPVPSKELEMALTKYDENGHAYLMSMEEAVEKGIITEEMRKAIGYRIPTEDKYSIQPLRIKGFLPKAAGEAIMLPKEITTLAGSDFDIDKIYIMLKTFVVNSPKVDYKKVNSAFTKYLTSRGFTKEAVREYVYGNPNKGISSIKDYIMKIEKGVSFGTEINGEFVEDEKGLEIFDWYKANKNKIMTSYSFEEETSLDNRDGRNNRIFDLQWSVLTNLDTMDKMFNPGSFDVQKKSARIINVLKNNPKYTYEELSKMSLEELDKLSESGSKNNIVFSSTQVYFHKQNMTAGKLIGIFANNNTSHAFLSMQNISLKLDEGFTFDGYTVDSTTNNKLDALKAKDGSLISKNIAGFLAASVDAVKDPVLNFMNLNTFTANTAMLLARLGFSSDSIGLFLTQPIIEDVTREYFKRSNEGYTSIDDVIKDFLPKDKGLIESMQKNLHNVPFTKEQLAKGISTKGKDESFQISSLLLFQKLANIAQDLNTLTFLTKFNSVTNAVGPTIADTLVMNERYKKFIDGMNEGTMPFSEDAVHIIENSPILEAFYDTTLGDGGASELIFKDYFPQYTETFKLVLERLRRTTKGSLDSKTINKLVNDFILYKLTLGSNPVLDSSEENRKKFMLNFTSEYSKRANGIVDNDLLNIIILKGKDSRCPVPTLEAKTGGYSSDIQERVKNGWSNLVLNPSTRELGSDLFFYNIFRSGFGYSPKTFGHLASVDVKLNVDGYVDTISNVEFNNDIVSIEDFLYMFRRNHTRDFKLVPRLEANDNVDVSTSSNRRGESSITFSFDKSKSGMNSIVISEGEETVWAPVIEFEGTIYMNPKQSGSSVTYIETTPLGNTNNFLEYDGNSGAYMKSVFSKSSLKEREKDNEVRKETPSEPEKVKVTKVTNKDISKVINTIWGGKEFIEAYKTAESNTGTEEEWANLLTDIVKKHMKLDRNSNYTETIYNKVMNAIKENC